MKDFWKRSLDSKSRSVQSQRIVLREHGHDKQFFGTFQLNGPLIDYPYTTCGSPLRTPLKVQVYLACFASSPHVRSLWKQDQAGKTGSLTAFRMPVDELPPTREVAYKLRHTEVRWCMAVLGSPIFPFGHWQPMAQKPPPRCGAGVPGPFFSTRQC